LAPSPQPTARNASATEAPNPIVNFFIIINLMLPDFWIKPGPPPIQFRRVTSGKVLLHWFGPVRAFQILAVARFWRFRRSVSSVLISAEVLPFSDVGDCLPSPLCTPISTQGHPTSPKNRQRVGHIFHLRRFHWVSTPKGTQILYYLFALWSRAIASFLGNVKPLV
jgi:hypothetical protein